MATFDEISTDLRNLRTSMKSRISSVLYEESRTLLYEFQDRSPVDSGEYRSRWRLLKSRFLPNNTLASFTLLNDTSYAIYMEEGTEKFAPPWYYPHRSSGKFRKGTGKLTVVNGRVWAGGLNPGHSKTVHGAIGPVLFDNTKRLNKLANKIADVVIGGIK